ncbi:hypothetical protein [Hyalangium rubrum]|uniref:DUF4123 domain-containing protein n=1 Tax=Hyalangium rubrum TaxID=3103134 RepID=A0ABU5HGB2_9BACT|nr:hypothetical protein [Hyalangium sp. s54d21]MDY7232491.1 hypothetical protein [Hyalangium sp. s54d21]
MRPVDVCSTVLITTGNQALREPGQARWDEVEELMGIRLRPAGRQPSVVTMLDEQGERQSFQEWLEARASPQARLWFVPGPWEADPESFPRDLPAHIREAFEGGGGLGLLLFTDRFRSERFMPREVRPRFYDITGKQLYAFMRSRKRAAVWEELLTRELAPELEGRGLQAFMESRSPEEMDALISRFMPLSAEAEPVGEGSELEPEETVKWNQFFTPAPGAGSLSFEYLPVGEGDEVTVARDLNACRNGLTRSLKSVQDFAQQQELKYWSKHFRRCLLRLTLEPQPLEDILELLILNGLPVPALQLVNAAMAADVFGGMGSWNDLSFDGADAQSYRVLSDRLLGAMRAAYRAGINLSAS